MCVYYKVFALFHFRIIYIAYGGGAYGLNGLLGQIDFPDAIVYTYI